MQVNIISLNVDGLTSSPELDMPEELLLAGKPDIYVEFTQEDGRHVNAPPSITVENNGGVSNENMAGMRKKVEINALKKNAREVREANAQYKPLNGLQEPFDPNFGAQSGGVANITLIDTNKLKGMKLAAHISLNPVKTDQNIITNIFVKNELDPKVEMGVIAFKPKAGKVGKVIAFVQSVASHIPGLHLGHSKGCVWVKLTFNTHAILFVNMHLPVATSKSNATMGYEFRKKAFYRILQKLSDKVDDSTSVIVGGDLNFRMSEGGVDQLTELLKSTNPPPIRLKELPFPPGQEPSFTCKFKKDSSENCRLKNISGDKHPACADASRVPSRCDRILVNGDPIVSLYDTGVLLPDSDHNAVYASVTIGPPMEGGRGKTRSRRRLRARRTRRSR